MTLTASFLAFQLARAANETWTGATNNAWATGSNWTGTNLPPISGDTLTFTANTGAGGLLLNNNLTTSGFVIGTSTNARATAITFNAGSPGYIIGDGTTTANAGGAFTLGGNIVNNSTSTQTINDAFTTTVTANSGATSYAGNSLNTTAGGGFLILNGNISGATATGATVGSATSSNAGFTLGGSGAVFFNGNNTFSGTTALVSTIQANVSLFVSANTTAVLGSNSAAGTGSINFNNVANGIGGTIRASSNLTLSNGIITNNVGGVIAAGGDITFNGLTQFGGSNTITVNNNTNFAGGIDIRDGTASTIGRVISFNGTGNVTVSGVISNGTAGAVGAIAYTGSGSLTLSNNNTYTGATSLYGGTLNLDYTTNQGAKLSSGAASILTLAGSTVNLINSPAILEAPSSTVLGPGDSSINAIGTVSGGINQGAGVNVKAFTRNPGSTLSTNAAQVIYTTSGTANALLVGSAGSVVGVVGGNDWAAKDASNQYVTGLSTTTTGYTASTGSTVAAGGNTDVVTNVALGGTAGTTSNLRFNTAGATNVDATGTNLVLTTGGILVTPAIGSATTSITGGTLQAGTNSGLYVFQNNTAAGLTISSTIADGSTASIFTKSGAGLVALTNPTNTFTGATYLNAGTLNIAADASLGTAPGAAVATQLTFNGGTLQFGQNNIALAANRGITLYGNGATFDTNGTTGSTINGVIVTTTANNILFAPRVVKTGAGTLTLNPTAGPNTYTGSTIINGGTLNLAKAGTNSGTAITGGTIAPTTVAPAFTINNGGTLLLSASYAVSPTSTLTLAGGTFSIGNGVLQGQGAALANGTGTGTNIAGGGLLTLTANSTLSFVGTSGTLVVTGFDPTNQLAGTFTLNITGGNFGTKTSSTDGTTDRFIVAQLLSASQLAAITFNGQTGATENLLTNGYYEILAPVPEPSAWALLTLSFGLGGLYLRRRANLQAA